MTGALQSFQVLPPEISQKLSLVWQSGPPAPKVPGRVPGQGDCWKDCWEQCRFSAFPKKAASQHCSQQSPQQPPSPATVPGTLPGTFWGDSGFLSPVAGGPDCQTGFWEVSKVLKSGIRQRISAARATPEKLLKQQSFHCRLICRDLTLPTLSHSLVLVSLGFPAFPCEENPDLLFLAFWISLLLRSSRHNSFF